jgi:hypothetical protein
MVGQGVGELKSIFLSIDGNSQTLSVISRSEHASLSCRVIELRPPVARLGDH